KDGDFDGRSSGEGTMLSCRAESPAHPEHAPTDVTSLMRSHHPQIADGDECMLACVDAFCQKNGPDPVIFNVGAGSGYLPTNPARIPPKAQIIAHETDPTLVTALLRKTRDTDVLVFDEPFERWSHGIDILISWGAHHQLPSGYLCHGRSLLAKG